MSKFFVVLVCKEKLPWTSALPFTSLKLNTYLRRILHPLLGFLLSHDDLLYLETTISAAIQAGIKRCVSYITFIATSAILCPDVVSDLNGLTFLGFHSIIWHDFLADHEWLSERAASSGSFVFRVHGNSVELRILPCGTQFQSKHRKRSEASLKVE